MANKTSLWVGGGAALAVLVWLALAGRDDDAGTAEFPETDFSEPREAAGSRAPTSETGRAITAESATETAPEAARDAAPQAAAQEPSAAVEPAFTAAAETSPFANNPIVANAPPSNARATPTDLPNRSNGDPLGAAPAADILNSLRISCDFAAGNNTGLRYGDVLTVGGGAQWRGGLIVYDNIDAFAGTARMTGSVGATSSAIGEAKVRFTTEGTRIHLTGTLEDRTYVVVTIFDELDSVGRHIAVMSRHGAGFAYAAQFLGTCE